MVVTEVRANVEVAHRAKAAEKMSLWALPGHNCLNTCANTGSAAIYRGTELALQRGCNGRPWRRKPWGGLERGETGLYRRYGILLRTDIHVKRLSALQHLKGGGLSRLSFASSSVSSCLSSRRPSPQNIRIPSRIDSGEPNSRGHVKGGVRL